VQGLLGPNGAGKTTLVRILATLLAPDTGQARISGVDAQRDPNTVRSLIGLAGQYAAVDEALTGRENLVMVGRLYRLGDSHLKLLPRPDNSAGHPTAGGEVTAARYPAPATVDCSWHTAGL
jgi:ABC-type multidrug transport system ATPase subunit